MGPLIDLTGRRFGKIIVLCRGKNDKHGAARWKCLCDCGKETSVRSHNLLRGQTKSCGIGECRFSWLVKPLEQIVKKRIISCYHRGAKDRGLEIQLSDRDIHDLVEQTCHYCGRKPYRPYKSCIKADSPRHAGEQYLCNGIDRKDSNVGYIKENCVPCCWECNQLKGKWSYDEFLKLIDLIAKHQNMRKVLSVE